MARGMRRGLGIRPVNSVKRIIDTTGSLTGGAVSVTTLAGVDTNQTQFDPTGSSAFPVGGHPSAIFYSLYIYTDATEVQSPLVDVYWWKNPAGSLTAPIAGATDLSAAKKFIIHEEKGLAGNRTTGMPMIVKGVLKMPPGMKRFALGDQFELRIKSITNGFFCAKHIFRIFY